jgi:hypothetical protein
MSPSNKELYDPVKVLQDPEFRIINSPDELPKEKDANLACQSRCRSPGAFGASDRARSG